MRQEVAEYLTLAYKGELAIREADTKKVASWAKETTKTLIERLKDQLGEPDKPVYTSNIIGQIKERKRPTNIPPIISRFITSLGGTFNEKNFDWSLPEKIDFEKGLLGAKILMARAFEFHMFPKALWIVGAITTGLLMIVSAVVVYLRPFDWVNIAIMVAFALLMALCIFRAFKYENFQIVAKTIRDRVIKSKSIQD